MKLMCKLFREHLNSGLQGLCYDESQKIKFENVTVFRNFIQNFTQRQLADLSQKRDKHNFIKLNITSSNIRFKNQLATVKAHKEDDDSNHIFFYIVIVMCFYSISIVFLLIRNIQLNFSIPPKDNNKYVFCDEENEATKVTIDMLFNRHKKLKRKTAVKKKRLSKKQPSLRFVKLEDIA